MEGADFAGQESGMRPAPAPQAVERAMSFIQQNHGREIGLVDQSHLTRYFKRVLGTMPGKMMY